MGFIYIRWLLFEVIIQNENEHREYSQHQYIDHAYQFDVHTILRLFVLLFVLERIDCISNQAKKKKPDLAQILRLYADKFCFSFSL